MRQATGIEFAEPLNHFFSACENVAWQPTPRVVFPISFISPPFFCCCDVLLFQTAIRCYVFNESSDVFSPDDPSPLWSTFWSNFMATDRASPPFSEPIQDDSIAIGDYDAETILGRVTVPIFACRSIKGQRPFAIKEACRVCFFKSLHDTSVAQPRSLGKVIP